MKNIFSLFFCSLIIGACTTQPKFANKLLPFSSDGCSMSPDGTSEQPKAFLECCVRHDYLYWQGGTSEQKTQADQELRACISKASNKNTGDLYWLGVRAGGGPEFKTPFRWGYGWIEHRGYEALSQNEEDQIFSQTKDIDWEKIYETLRN